MIVRESDILGQPGGDAVAEMRRLQVTARERGERLVVHIPESRMRGDQPQGPRALVTIADEVWAVSKSGSSRRAIKVRGY